MTNLALELVAPDGTPLLAPPLVFESCEVDAAPETPGPEKPPAALRRVLKAALRACVDDLLEHRPDEATRVAKALGVLAVDATKRSGRAALQKHFPKTTASLGAEPRAASF